ncbi:MAG: DUF2442 domain-containing protein [Deltaproteobacteria bacterium]|nr:DUF2442 domain-containing protein [Deltaproteobacteria bacterium]
MIRVIEARYVKDYVVWLRFSDGTEGKLDLRGELHGEIFEPLRDKRLFRSVAVHPDWHTIAWPNGADFAPEFLHAAVKARLTKRSSRPRPQSRSRGHARAGASRNG